MLAFVGLVLLNATFVFAATSAPQQSAVLPADSTDFKTRTAYQFTPMMGEPGETGSNLRRDNSQYCALRDGALPPVDCSLPALTNALEGIQAVQTWKKGSWLEERFRLLGRLAQATGNELYRLGDWGYQASGSVKVSDVRLNVYQLDRRIASRTDRRGPYCAYGESGSQCVTPQLAAGTYEVEAVARFKNGSTGRWRHEVTVSSSATATSTPTQAATATPTSSSTAPKISTPTATPTSTSAPVDAVRINVGDNWQNIVNANPEGRAFVIAAGVHRNQKVAPRKGQSFLGEPGAIMDGGGTVDFAFRGTASGVTIKGLIIQAYRSPLQRGAIKAEGTDWLIESNEVRRNARGGIEAYTRSRVIGNHVHHNGQIGVKADNSVDALVEGNEIAFNNCAWAGSTSTDCPWPGTDPGWEAGGTKFALTTRLVVRNNYVHDNKGPGLWTDIDNIDTTYDSNRVVNNCQMGIFHEVSYDAVIKNNEVEGNGGGLGGCKGTGWGYGAQILIAHSPNVEVYGNRVIARCSGCDGIMILQQERGSGKYGPHIATGNYIHGNEVVLMATGTQGWAAGATSDYTSGLQSVRNNRFEGNRYVLPTTSARTWSWGSSDLQWSGWQSAGQDRSGSISTQ